jgi:hypothetical protein
MLFTLKESSNEVEMRKRIHDLVVGLGRLSEASSQAILQWLKGQGERAIPSLALALEDDDPLLRERAIRGLAILDSATAATILKDHLLEERDEIISDQVERSLNESTASPLNDEWPESVSPDEFVRNNQRVEHRRGERGPERERHTSERLDQERQTEEGREKEVRKLAQERIERQHERVNSWIKHSISTSQQEVTSFIEEFNRVERRANSYINASRQALKGIGKLEKWSKVERGRARIRSSQVSRLIDKTNEYLREWYEHTSLSEDIGKVAYQHSVLNHNIMVYRQRGNELLKVLTKLEREYSTGMRQRLLWKLQRWVRAVSNVQRQLNQVRLERKVEGLAQRIEKTRESVSASVSFAQPEGKSFIQMEFRTAG